MNFLSIGLLPPINFGVSSHLVDFFRLFFTFRRFFSAIYQIDKSPTIKIIHFGVISHFGNFFRRFVKMVNVRIAEKNRLNVKNRRKKSTKCEETPKEIEQMCKNKIIHFAVSSHLVNFFRLFFTFRLFFFGDLSKW